MASITPIEKQQRSKSARFSEIGRTGIRRFTGTVVEEFLRTLQGQQGVRVYREMKDNDPIVGACLFAIEQVIRQATWFVRPASDSNVDRSAAEFVGQCMDDMSHSWNDLISEVLSMLAFGRVWFELVYKLRKGESNNPALRSKFNDGAIGWRKIPIRMQSSWVGWEFDDAGGIQALVQSPPPDYDNLTIPIEKSLLFRTKLEGNNPEGRSILRNAYRPWYFKKNLEVIEAIGVERDLVGLPVFTPPDDFDIEDPENTEIKTQIDKLIGNLRRDEQEGIMLPPMWQVELLTIGSSRRQFDVDKIINRYDKRIAITMLAQFVMLGMDRVGSFALGKTQNDLFLTAVQGILDSIAEVFNRFAIPRLVDYNPRYRSDKYPSLIPSKVTSPNLQDLASYINALVKGNLLPTEDPKLRRDLIRLGRFSEPSENRLGELYEEDEYDLERTRTAEDFDGGDDLDDDLDDGDSED